MASPGQPVFSIVQTAGVRKILTAADFNAVSPFYASVSFAQLLTKIEVNYDAPTPGPHWLIISPDRTQTAIAVPTMMGSEPSSPRRMPFHQFAIHAAA